jgi:hypothetical protein
MMSIHYSECSFLVEEGETMFRVQVQELKKKQDVSQGSAEVGDTFTIQQLLSKEFKKCTKFNRVVLKLFA